MFPRKTVLLLLLAIVLVSLVVRFPLVEHERYESDSYFIHGVSNSIVREGQAAWTFNPLSYVGYYPFSYPSGVPFVLAEMSILTGLNMDVCILMVDAILATLLCLVIFCLSRELIHRTEFALLAALLVATAPRFVDTTYWVGSARGLEVVMITLLVFVTFRSGFSRSNLFLVVSALIGFACLAVHHMAVLLILYGAGYVLAVLTMRYLPVFSRNRGKKWAVVAALSLGLGATLVSLSYFGVLGNSVESFGDTGFFEIKSPLIGIPVNLAIAYAHQIGPVLLLAAFGIIAYLRAPRLRVRAAFPIVILIAFVPVIGSSLYVSMLLTPFVAMLGVDWIQNSRKLEKLKIRTFAVAVLIVLSLVITVWSVGSWNHSRLLTGDTVLVDDGVFNDAAYLDLNGHGVYAMSNSEFLTGPLGAYSSTRFLTSGIGAAINKDVTGQDIKDNMEASSTPFPGNLYSWYTYSGESQVSQFVFAVMVNGADAINEANPALDHDYAANHSNLLVVVDNNWPQDYASSYGPVSSQFLNEIRNSQTNGTYYHGLFSYCTYASQRVTIYAVQLPAK